MDMPAKPAPVMDLSKINFEALRTRFKEAKQKNTDLEVLKATSFEHVYESYRETGVNIFTTTA